jgi:hypothetical protein
MLAETVPSELLQFGLAGLIVVAVVVPLFRWMTGKLNGKLDRLATAIEANTKAQGGIQAALKNLRADIRKIEAARRATA